MMSYFPSVPMSCDGCIDSFGLIGSFGSSFGIPRMDLAFGSLSSVLLICSQQVYPY